MELNEGKLFDDLFWKKQIGLKRLYCLPTRGYLTSCNNTGDLRVIDNNLGWVAHRSSVVDIARKMRSWILKTLRSREQNGIASDFSPNLYGYTSNNFASRGLNIYNKTYRKVNHPREISLKELNSLLNLITATASKH